MAILVTNSLTRKKEPLAPLEANKIKMYVCGPTVYGLTHVGNARPPLFFEVVRRYLKFKGYQVTLVSNFTDVDDKIINKAREEKTTAEEVAKRYTKEFIQDMNSLGITRPDAAPKATETIPEMIQFIQGLVAKGAAYVAKDGEVFYSVRSFKGYGKLSGKNIDDLISGARVEPGENKRDPLDFSLWKPRKAPDEPAWESPWGLGRPGWHIECSAMALKHLGETFDIHGGGIDLTHPHHENEIAQSEAYTGKPFVKVWMHVNLVSIGNEKMSKSLGNIFLNRDFIQNFTAEALKFLILSGQYRSPIDFSDKHIRDCQAALHRFYTTTRKCESIKVPAGNTAPTAEEKSLLEFGVGFPAKWKESLDDDFNTAKVVGLVFEYVRFLNGYLDKKGFKPTSSSGEIAKQFLQNRADLSAILNLFGEEPTSYLQQLREKVIALRGLNPKDIEKWVTERNEARAKKDFATADRLRTEIAAKGIEIRDTPNGTEWDISFSA